MVGKIKPTKNYTIINSNGSVVIDSNKVDSDYYITFRINNKCNLACEYCHWHAGENYEYEDIVKTVDKLYEFFALKNFKVVTLYFHGGEASFHPRVIDILKHIRQQETKSSTRVIIEFQTNLSLQNYSKIEPFVDFFSVSYHYLDLKKFKLQESFDNNIKALPKNKLLNLDIMLENIPEEELEYFYSKVTEYLEYPFQNSEMIYGFCHYKYNDVTRDRHIAFYNQHNKSEQQYDIDGEIYNTNDLFREGLNCEGMLCDAGKRNIVINADGNVFICGIDMTNYTNRCMDTQPYTNLITSPIGLKKLSILQQTGMKCKWDYCGGDFYLGKRMPDDS